jgi:hypothetical protein
MRFIPARHAGRLAAQAILEDDPEQDPPAPTSAESDTDDPEEDIDPKEVVMGYMSDVPVIKGNSIIGWYEHLKTNVLKGRLRRKVDRNTYAILNTAGNPWSNRGGDDTVSIKFHWTDVINVQPDDTLTISTGGIESISTLDRINHYLPSGWSLYVPKWSAEAPRRGDFHWHIHGLRIMNPRLRVEIPASSGDHILADGTLILHDKPVYSQRRKPVDPSRNIPYYRSNVPPHFLK